MANLLINLSQASSPTQSPRAFTFRDVRAFGSIDKTKLVSSYDVDAIRGSIRNIMEFRIGQRPLDPNFGNPLYNYLYSTGPMADEGLKTALITTFQEYEPRIEISSINVSRDDDVNPHTINLSIYYYIKGLPNSLTTYSVTVGL